MITPDDLVGPGKADLEFGEGIDLPDEIKLPLKNLIDAFEKEDEPARLSHLPKLQRNELYWRGIQDIYYSEVAHGYKTVNGAPLFRDEAGEEEYQDYNNIINVFRAIGESIIAASTTQIPHVRFFPDDADSPEDIITSKAATRIARLIQKHNQVEQILAHAFYIRYTQDFVASYTYHHEDDEYGQTKVPVWGKRNFHTTVNHCASCGSQVGGPVVEEGDILEDIEGPENQDPSIPIDTGEHESAQEDIPGLPPPEQVHSTVESQEPPDPVADAPGGLVPETDTTPGIKKEFGICPTCGEEKGPQMLIPETTTEPTASIIDWSEEPKGRELIEVYGPLNVKIPRYVKDFKKCPYLILETEEHYTYLRGIYPGQAESIHARIGDEGYSRLLPEVDASGLLTHKRCWIRPWAYNWLLVSHPEVLELFIQQYPDGLKACIVEDKIVSIEPEAMDDHWEITKDPLSSFLHSVPLGEPVIPIQNMRNDLVALSMETVKHGIGETFADPDVLNFQLYQQHRNKPGVIFPAKARKGQNLESSFYSQKNATLSKEVSELFGRLDSDSQFVSGAYPSVYGGHSQGGSKTLGEYVESRSQALQRLSTPWKVIYQWWAKTIFKAVKSFINHASEDERFSEKEGTSFVNTWIKLSELQGKIGSVEPEISEQFPETWAQKRAMLMDLLQLNLEPFLATLFAPENVSFVASLLGFSELTIPGEADRNKQLQEIAELLKSPPNEQVDPVAQIDPSAAAPPTPQPTIMPDEVDNDEIHVKIIDSWAVSEIGQDTKINNPDGYANVMAHRGIHMEKIQAAMMQAAPQGQAPPPKPNGQASEARA